MQKASARTYNTHVKNIAQQILLLTDQKILLNNKINQLTTEQKTFKENPPANYQQVKQLSEQIKVRSEMTNMLVDELSQSLDNAQQQASKLGEAQKNLQVRLLSEQIPEEKESTSHKLNYAADLINLNQKESDLLLENLILAKKLSKMYQRYFKNCLALMESIQKTQAIQELRKKIAIEQQLTDRWLGEINALNQQKGTSKAVRLTDQIKDESRLFYYTQQVQLSSIKITVLEASIRDQKIVEAFKNVKKDVNSGLKTTAFKAMLTDAEETLQGAEVALEQRRQLMAKQIALMNNALKNKWLSVNDAVSLGRGLSQLNKKMDNLAIELNKQNKLIQNMQDKFQNYLAQTVAKRQALLKTDEKLASGFLSQLMGLPKLLITYLKGLWEQVWSNIGASKTSVRFFLSIVVIVSVVLWWYGRKYFRILSTKFSEKRQRTAVNIVYMLSELFRRNWGSLCLFLLGWFILGFSGIDFDAYLGLFYTALIWFSFRVIMGIARIILVERESDTQGHDVSLYHRLKWVFIIGGWVTVLVVLSKQFEIGGVVFEISNRLFMGFLLTVSVVLIRARKVIPSLLDPIFSSRKYLSRTIHTVCWFLPFGFFVSTALGLMGYINLSWILIYYQAALVLVVASYIILRGIVADLFDIASEWVIRRLNQGWLWSEAFLKPIDRILRIFLFLAMVVSVFLVLGWRDDSLVVIKMQEFFFYTFFNFSGINVTLCSIIELIALVSFFFWLAKWTREFAYRWLFRNAKDIGIRNSLAVLSQYIIITLGSVITLRILGVDVTGLSVILGGLAVGLGFGLRDFASNIVGGLMLLIERSVKEGDIVSIGNYEGEVTHIGIRAMHIRSWDHMEIMVPNSEIFMRAFMNWTHQDSTVRTVVPMKIHRVDDPAAVQQMILNLLHDIPEVLAEPHPEVFFVNMDSALIEFEVRYFINISVSTRSEIRSKVLLIILQAFKEAGIRPPYSQQDSYVWELNSGAHDHWQSARKK